MEKQNIGKKRGKRVTITDQARGRKISLTEQVFRALKIAAEHPDWSVEKIADEMGVATQSVYNLLGEVYRELGVNEDRVDRRGAATKWYNEVVKSASNEQITPRVDTSEESTFRSTKSQQREFISIITTIYICICILIFIPIVMLGTTEGTFNAWSNLYVAIPITGSVLGYLRMQSSNQSVNSPYFSITIKLCLGYLFWGLGGFIWLYYNVTRKDYVPYPSYADIGYVLGVIFIFLGVKEMYNNIVGSIIPRLPFVILFSLTIGIACGVAVLAVRGWALIPDKDPGKVILDIFYPTSDIIILTLLSLCTINKTSQGVEPDFQKSIYLLYIGMFLYFIADISFSITTTLPQEHPWAYFTGNWSDFVFATTFFVLSLANLHIPLSSHKGIA